MTGNQKNDLSKEKKETENNILNSSKYSNFKEVLSTFYSNEVQEIKKEETDDVEENVISIMPKMVHTKTNGQEEYLAEFSIGNKKVSYPLNELSAFYDRVIYKKKFKYSSTLEFVHKQEAFDEKSKGILNFILKYAEIIKYVNTVASFHYKYYGKTLDDNNIILSNTVFDEFFKTLVGQYIDFESEGHIRKIELVDGNPNIKFKVEKINDIEYAIMPEIDIHEAYTTIIGKDYTYMLMDNKIYRCSEQFVKTSYMLVEVFRNNMRNQIMFRKEHLPNFCSLIMPKMKKDININENDKEEIEKYIPKTLGVKVFLDFDKRGYVTAKVQFCYGNIEFNPLDINEKVKVSRNILSETECLNMFKKSGFLFDKNHARFVLINDDDIYEFLSKDIEDFMRCFEVLVTDNFKEKEVREPKLGTLGVRIENNLLNIDLTGLDVDEKELPEILRKYSIKKKYHRLKDGSFLNLEDSEDIKFVDNLLTGMDIQYEDIKDGIIKAPIHRSLYLNKILDNLKNTEVIKDSNYTNIINNIESKGFEDNIIIPENLKGTLRYYQKTGYKWLKVLDEYKLGGILADDMGLGKTIQILTIITSYVQSTPKEDRRPSIVIAPSSLTLNWKNEVNKFAKEITVLVINGNVEERKEKISNILDYDLIIRAYDSLKRDIEEENNEKYDYRDIIADEAQYLKNSNTKNAKAIKNINAQTRYALTGTPIENSLAELWSIFDYIMPGYLYGYKKFKQNYETPIIVEHDKKTMDRLKMLIEPFVLRRTKKEVLTELPDKTVTILNNEMEDEQLKLYMTYLAQARQELSDEIEAKGFEKSQMKILGLLTRLRQICCHPSLFIENYNSECGKLNQCIELIKDAIASNHKILLFSGYTSMFPIIEKELKREDIKYLKLTGQTKVDERIELVDKFNEDSSIKVFLISLKAGGTGLNLTGADMVIHYDPWWNLSVENQATDRAYRIGQKNNVQVYKLITKNSIEEKIYDLQQRKAALADSMLSTETTFINKLSKEDILELFK